MTLEHLITVWSIRLALLLFFVVVAARWRLASRGAGSGRGWRVLRLMWVAGCLLALLHVLAIFGYVMDWSHQAAIADTARRTQRAIGVAFGGGVYFNYAFLLAWVCDAAWWCGWPERYLRRAWLWELLVIGYLWFIAFNAAVVFETGIMRWLGLLATLALAGSAFLASAAWNRIR